MVSTQNPSRSEENWCRKNNRTQFTDSRHFGINACLQRAPPDVLCTLSTTSRGEVFSICWKSGDTKIIFFAAARRWSTASVGNTNEVGN